MTIIIRGESAHFLESFMSQTLQTLLSSQAPKAGRVASLAVLLLALGAASGVHAAGAESPAPEARALSRAEVIADLRLWQRARVDRYVDLATSQQLQVDEYQKALAEYRQLRNGPAFAQEVARVRAELGEVATAQTAR
ncbi:MAG: hypothetical protein DI603_05815 [Roseateles depolymerans]|uniref:DUF4148 domain-containing protein n=1 Tax=Roseateles depolymerans TaxID=76731 RepID=A0A2W5E0G1_9BURK|nr:MAG: hypothetical protein DI603_05815 [Roseateles depolymerans]